MAVRRELQAGRDALAKIIHQREGVVGIATADLPRHDQLAVGIKRRPKPDIAIGQVFALRSRDILRLGVAERPYLVTLDALALYPTNGPNVELSARRAGIPQQLVHCIKRTIDHAT